MKDKHPKINPIDPPLPEEQFAMAKLAMDGSATIRHAKGRDITPVLFFPDGERVAISPIPSFQDRDKNRLAVVVAGLVNKLGYCVFAVEAWMAMYEKDEIKGPLESVRLPDEEMPRNRANKVECIIVTLHAKGYTVIWQCEILGPKELGSEWKVVADDRNKENKIAGRLIPEKS